LQINISLSNAKPSAIFAIKGKGQASSLTDPNPTITLGISIEPLSSVDSQVQSLHPTSSSMTIARLPPPITVVAQRIAKNLFNYLSSFATQNLPPGVMTLGGLRPDATYVPLKAFEDWWSKFNHKVESDPGFLERDSSD
jgi:protein Hikeshi